MRPNGQALDETMSLCSWKQILEVGTTISQETIQLTNKQNIEENVMYRKLTF